MIDGATEAGANKIQSLQYRLRNPRSAEAETLRAAAEDAKAEAVASGVGLRVLRVISAAQVTSEDAGFGFQKKAPAPPPPGHAEGMPTPVEIDPIEITASVIVKVEVGR